MSRKQINSVRFRLEREASWKELETYLELIESKGVKSLTPNDIVQFTMLFRVCISSLSVARAISLDEALLKYLENLSARAYGIFYGFDTSKRGYFRNIFRWEIPRSLHASRVLTLIAFAVYFLGFMTGWSMIATNQVAPNHIFPAPSFLLPDMVVSHPNATSFFHDLSLALYANSAKWGLLMIGLGFAMGIPTGLILFFNGLMMGVQFASIPEGARWEYLSWVLGRSSLDMAGMVLCAAAGFWVARATMFPKRQDRGRILAAYGHHIAHLGIAGLLLFTINVFLSVLIDQISAGGALFVGLLELAALVAYYVIGCKKAGISGHFFSADKDTAVPANPQHEKVLS